MRLANNSRSTRAIHLQNEVAEHSPLELTSTPGPSHPWYLSVPVSVSRLLHVQWPLWVTDKDCGVTAYHPNLRLSLISSAASTTGLSSHRAPDHTRHYRNLSLFACTAHIVASSGSRSPEPQELLGPAELLEPPESLGSLEPPCLSVPSLSRSVLRHSSSLLPSSPSSVSVIRQSHRNTFWTWKWNLVLRL